MLKNANFLLINVIIALMPKISFYEYSLICYIMNVFKLKKPDTNGKDIVGLNLSSTINYQDE